MKLPIFLLSILLAGKGIGIVCQALGYLPMPLCVILAPFVALFLVFAAAYGLMWFRLGHKPRLADVLPFHREPDPEPHPGVWISGTVPGSSKSRIIARFDPAAPGKDRNIHYLHDLTNGTKVELPPADFTGKLQPLRASDTCVDDHLPVHTDEFRHDP